MQYTPETIYVGKIIAAEWGQKIEQMFQRMGNYMGVVDSVSQLPNVSEAAESDWYIVRQERQIYQKINNQWENIGGVSYDQLIGTVPRSQLSGTYDIDITGTQAQQTKLQTQHTINGVGFDGTQNITVTQTTPNKVTFNSSGGQQPGTTFNGSAQITVSYETVGAQQASHTHTNYLSRDGGTMNTTTLVTNLNADMVDGYHQSSFSLSSHTHDSTYLKKAGDTMTGNLNCNQVVNCNQNANSRLVLPVGTNKYAT